MSTTKEETLEVTKNIVIDAPPEVVFKAITDQNELTNWFPDQAILETKVGGKMKFSFYKNSKRGNNQECGRDTDKFAEGTVTEFILNKKISYTWENSAEPDFPTTVVTSELEKIDNEKTNLKLLHTGFKASEKVKQYDGGWSHFLNELKKYCEKTK
ncbi:MAG TPA: SRPBCC domain-containing protein [Candidatus Bathyarchaeia archaeon]|nr:SRPBCC domain-containing protein [Candidatus Bathyarchaeia archaeon]